MAGTEAFILEKLIW